MLHAFAGSKADLAADAARYARAGYAVLVPSPRGFGRSCGVPDSRTADCARGWMHLADQRFEVRDVQHLLGLLVDQGVARADALGATGVSYGGGQTLQLAMLRDRVVLPNGARAPWTSPAGRRLSLAAAYARWPWSDLADALLPNGRLGTATYASPVGVELQSWMSLLATAAARTGFVAPAGAEPTADLTTWQQRLERGEPYGGDVRAALTELHRFHSPIGVRAPARAPRLLIQAGWTDDLFPAGQSVRLYDLLRAADRGAPVSLQLGDLGHNRAANHPVDNAQMAAAGLRFFEAPLKGTGGGPAPAGSVTAHLQRCPRNRPSTGRPVRAASFARLARGALRITSDRRQRVTSSGGDAGLAAALDPLRLDPCRSVDADAAAGTAIASRRSPGFTLLGRTSVRAQVRVRGSAAQLVGRLWDVDPATGRQRLVDRGVVRLRSARTVSFALNGNGWLRPRAPRQARARRARRAGVPPVERHVQRGRVAAQGRAADAGAALSAASAVSATGALRGEPTWTAASTMPTHSSVARATCTQTISAGSSRRNWTIPTTPWRAMSTQMRVRRSRRTCGAPPRRASHQVTTATTPSAAASTPWRLMSHVSVSAPWNLSRLTTSPVPEPPACGPAAVAAVPTASVIAPSTNSVHTPRAVARSTVTPADGSKSGCARQASAPAATRIAADSA
jgi:hypothetical protein